MDSLPHENNFVSPSDDTESTLNYEEALRELEEIVASLEDGNVPLDKSLEMVQRGRELSEICAQILQEAELSLTRLAASPEGELIEEPLDWQDENEE